VDIQNILEGVKGKIIVTRHTTQLQGDLPTPLTHNTQQHYTTTPHNSTRVHKTTNVFVVFMALILNGFEGCNIITRGIGRGGVPENLDFFVSIFRAHPFQCPS
jgi:hypothetical protein